MRLVRVVKVVSSMGAIPTVLLPLPKPLDSKRRAGCSFLYGSIGSVNCSLLATLTTISRVPMAKPYILRPQSWVRRTHGPKNFSMIRPLLLICVTRRSPVNLWESFICNYVFLSIRKHSNKHQRDPPLENCLSTMSPRGAKA